MTIQSVEQTLSSRPWDLIKYSDDFYRAISSYKGRPYAVHYFDLSGQIVNKAKNIRTYLSDKIGTDYFDTTRPVDLRWNNYFYFVVDKKDQGKEFALAKQTIEEDREFARKFVLSVDELRNVIGHEGRHEPVKVNSFPEGLFESWLGYLNEKQLGYVLDFSLQVPAVVRKLLDGNREMLEAESDVATLSDVELAVDRCSLLSLSKQGFRDFPSDGEFKFGSKVNLICGPNGFGKTSLLETIEYLYTGNTFRNGSPDRITKIEGVLSDTEGVLSIKSDVNNNANLRARNLSWYGKNDLKGSTLTNSFSRFNFMDTDAAVRISSESDSDGADRLSEDIVRMILGPEANKASDRIQRVADTIEQEKNRIKPQIEGLISKKNVLDEEIQVLEKAPSISGAVIEGIANSLSKLRWKKDKPSLDEGVLVNLAAQLDEVAPKVSNTQGLKYSVVKDRVDTLSSRLIELRKLQGVLLEAESDRVQFESGVTTSKVKIAELGRLQEIWESNLEKYVEEQRSLSKSISDSETLVADCGQVISELDGFLDDCLFSALEDTQEKQKHLDTLIGQLAVETAAMEKFHMGLTSIRQQIVSLGRSYIDQAEDKCSCPLCNAKYENAQVLLERIGKDEAISSVKDLSIKRLELEKNRVERDQTLRVTEILSSFSKYFEDDVTVGDAINQYRQISEQLESDKSLMSSVSDKIAEIKSLGYSLVERDILMNRYNFSTEDKGALSSMLAGEIESLEFNSKKLESASKKKEDGNSELMKIAQGLGVSETPSAQQLIGDLEIHISIYQDKMETLSNIETFFDKEVVESESALYSIITDIRNSCLNALTNLRQSSANSIRTIELKKELVKLQESLEAAQNRSKNIGYAYDSLQQILSGDISITKIKNKIIRDNEEKISDIFSKIHLPSEYRVLMIDGDIKLQHVESEELRKLTMVSTGQRAAFAISLFLAMNDSVRGAPKIVIFDDPISHVDDINVLSFLDFLRDLVLEGNRQIFFATPSRKLAGLFKHKFSFLDDSELKVIDLKR